MCFKFLVLLFFFSSFFVFPNFCGLFESLRERDPAAPPANLSGFTVFVCCDTKAASLLVFFCSALPLLAVWINFHKKTCSKNSKSPEVETCVVRYRWHQYSSNVTYPIMYIIQIYCSLQKLQGSI